MRSLPLRKWNIALSGLVLASIVVGVVLSISASRSATQDRSFAATCTTPTENTTHPWGGLVYVNWTAGIPDIHSITTSITVYNDAGVNAPEYLQLYDQAIDDTGQYFGMQGSGMLIFSRFGTNDTTNIRTAPGATVYKGTNEGAYISLRYPNYFGTSSLPQGNYHVTVKRAEFDGVGDWFNYSIQKGTEAEQYIGGIRFPRKTPGVPASFADGGGTWTEDFRDGRTSIFSLPEWHVAVMPIFNETTTPQAARLTYNPVIPNSDGSFDGNLVHLRSGNVTPRCTPAGSLFTSAPPLPSFQATAPPERSTPMTRTPTSTPTTPPATSATSGNSPPQTTFHVTTLIHGLGAGGDNRSLHENTASNKYPTHPKRPFVLELQTTESAEPSSLSGELVYNPAEGTFSGSVHTDRSLPTALTGYRIIVPGLLTGAIETPVAVQPGRVNTVPTVTLITGDVDGDNTLSILDFNILAQCYEPARPASACTLSEHADLNDDDRIDILDYNLWLRELIAQMNN